MLRERVGTLLINYITTVLSFGTFSSNYADTYFTHSIKSQSKHHFIRPSANIHMYALQRRSSKPRVSKADTIVGAVREGEGGWSEKREKEREEERDARTDDDRGKDEETIAREK